MNPRSLYHRSTGWLALGALLPALAFGQATPPPATPPAGDTVLLSPFTVNSDEDQGYYSPQSVSGTRTRTELINLPMSIQVLTEQFIADIAARDLIDIVQFASGVTVGTGQATNDGDNTSFTLRGQVGFVPMRNGFRRLRAAPAANIDRVEVLKGPASLLYGQLNPGGNINYITKRPQPTRQIANFTAQVGSYELYRGIADLNVPIVPKKLALRFVGSFEDSQSITARLQNVTSLVNPSLTWWIRPETTLTVELEQTKRNINAPKAILPFHARQSFEDQNYPIDRSWNTHTSQDYTDTEMTATTAELIHRFNPNLLLRANVTKAIWYDEVKRNGSNVNLVSNATGFASDLLPVRTIGFGKRGSWDQWKQFELVNNFKWRGVDGQNIVGYQHEILEFRLALDTAQSAPSTGVQWNVRDPSTWVLTNLGETDTRVLPNTGLFSTNVTHSYYFANQLSFLGGRLRTLAGLRYDKFRVFSFVPARNPQRAQSEAEPAKIPQVGVLFKVLPSLSVYATYSESFLPVFNTGRRSDGTFFSPGPQSGIGYDLGLKWQTAQGRISGTAAVYHIENTDIVRFLPPVTIQGAGGPETFSPIEQSGTDASEGFEIDLRLRPLPNTQVMFGYGYTDAWVKSDNAARATINGQVYFTRTGHWLQNSPRHAVSGWVRHDLGAIGPFKGTWVMGGGRHASERVFTEAFNIIAGVPTAPPKLRPYNVLDLGVGGRFAVFGREYTVSLQAKNILDEKYLENRFHFGAPRTLVFTFSAKF